MASPPAVDELTPDNRALFNVLLKDKDESKAIGNYMRNREVPASAINPLLQSTEQRLVMEVGYDLTDVVEEWGGFSYGISASVQISPNVNFLRFGYVSKVTTT